MTEYVNDDIVDLNVRMSQIMSELKSVQDTDLVSVRDQVSHHIEALQSRYQIDQYKEIGFFEFAPYDAEFIRTAQLARLVIDKNRAALKRTGHLS